MVITSSTSREGAITSSVMVDTANSDYAKLRSLALSAVTLKGGFWEPRLTQMREVTLRQQWDQCESTGRIDNFRRASGRKPGEFQGRYFNDSDVYKWLEAASYALAVEHDTSLEEVVDDLIQEIAAAQSPNGYLNTYFTFERESERWADLTNKHEMYCAGHFIQAAVAHNRATGKRGALEVAIRLADHLCVTFGPRARQGTDGHEEIELALVELYRATGNRRYLDQAVFFLDMRGLTPPLVGGLPYHQDHLPVRHQREVVGHAVRVTYLAIAMADVYSETGDIDLWEAVQAQWRSAYERKAYVTGGLGARWLGEAFGPDYELPNQRAYSETCAAIGGFMWNWRMLLVTGEPRYADWMETALYNGILSGLSLNGREYFYQNPLADDGAHRRQPWFGTACCPPNVARLLLSLPGYLYSTSQDALWVHHYAAGELRFSSGNHSGVLSVKTEYPWDGRISLTLVSYQGAAGESTLHLRVPGWCSSPRVTINGAALVGSEPGTYAAVRREWKAGDVVEIDLPMTVRHVRSHPFVASNYGRIALARGPLVYCLEGVDHPDVDLRDIRVPATTDFHAEQDPDVLGGVYVVRGRAYTRGPVEWGGQLYAWGQPSRSSEEVVMERTLSLAAVPYFAWANREPGQMQVWIRDEQTS
ncbi:MAG TPA: beta-L-arabinofuranosidase domain-containing protein [Chloroflexota bacterium]|nr:beta-L-arabinofuranosidase domain-containing protein [Chloroflexota bacterium]